MDSPTHTGHQKPADHAAGVDARGDHAMGFSHEKTAHHFTLLPDGGVIAVAADSSTDTASRDQIRMHLTHIAAMFSANNFDVPMFIHDKVPRGVPVMKQQHDAITYIFQPTTSGGRIRITTHNADALQAIHAFLRFQIADHRTGDAGTVQPAS
jgi:hypothetical protein